MKNLMREILAPVFFAIVLPIIFAIWFGIFQAKQEAKTFNRCTGANITWQEAMFSQFRIENCK